MTVFRSRRQGFSLPELLITLAILAIVAAIAVPAWRTHVMKVRRGEAMTLLLQLAARQEQFRLQSLRYADGAELTASPPAGLGMNFSESHYQVATMGTAAEFQATATVRVPGAQESDTQCWRFAIDSTGLRRAETQAGADSTADCW